VYSRRNCHICEALNGKTIIRGWVFGFPGATKRDATRRYDSHPKERIRINSNVALQNPTHAATETR